MYSTLEVSVAGPIGRMWLNRPERLNALSTNMVGIERAWSDADGLITGLLDPACAEARAAYIQSRL